jgi:undecaprenyl-diphosphatase
MSPIEVGALGLLQGLTEFLPVSSSAHLRIAGSFLPSGDPGAVFTAVVQVGTEAAVLFYFRRDILRIVTAWFAPFVPSARPDRADARMGWLILLGTLPIAILGVWFKSAIEGNLRNLYVTAAMLIVFGLLLGVADRKGRKQLVLGRLTWRDGVLLGFAQAMALVPGVSRSGGTITAGLLLGYRREAAARFSFLLAVPAVLASGTYQLIRYSSEFTADMAAPTVLATLVAFASGYGVIVVFLRLISQRSYMPFVIYRVGLGCLLMAGLLSGRIVPL